MKECAPAGCLVCRYPASTAEEVYGPIHVRCLITSADVLPWLVMLKAGPLGGCVACRASSMWHHPVHGPLHPACVRRAMELFNDGGGEVVAVVPRSGPRRGAYARRAVVG